MADDLVERLRGIYRISVDDGAGPLNGETTFTRQFETSPISHEAADRIEALTAELARYRAIPGLADVLEGKAVVVPSVWTDTMLAEFTTEYELQERAGNGVRWQPCLDEALAASPYAKEKTNG